MIASIGPDAVPALVPLSEAREDGVRLVSRLALAHLGDTRAGVDALVRALPDPPASAALEALPSEESIPALSAVIKGSTRHSHTSRQQAARALQRISPDRADDVLAEALRSPEAYQRVEALEFLADREKLQEQWLMTLVQLAGDDNHLVRLAVAKMLSRWPESEAAAYGLIRLSQDSSHEVAWAAHQALLRSRALAAVAYLCDALLAPDETVSDEASSALRDRDPRLLSVVTAAIYDGREVDVRTRQHFRKMHNRSAQLTHPRDDLALAWMVVSRPGLAAYVEGLDATSSAVVTKLAELLSTQSLNEALASEHPQARLLAARILARLEEDAGSDAGEDAADASPPRDGLSRETAVVVGSIADEYRWIAEHYPDYKTVWQSFGDVIHIRSDEGDELNLFFDIWSFFGRQESGS
jgi:HEAT repeat protein